MNQKENKDFPYYIENPKNNGKSKLGLCHKDGADTSGSDTSRSNPRLVEGYLKKRKYFFGEVTPIKNNESMALDDKESLNHLLETNSTSSPVSIPHVQLDHPNKYKNLGKDYDNFLTPLKSRLSPTHVQNNQQPSSPTKDYDENSDFSENIPNISSSQDAQVTWNVSPPKLVLLSSQVQGHPADTKSDHSHVVRKSVEELELWDKEKLEDDIYGSKGHDTDDPASNLLQKYNANYFIDDSEDISSTFPSYHPPSSSEKKQQCLKLRRINSEIAPPKSPKKMELSTDSYLKSTKPHKKYQLRSPRSLRRSLSTNDASKNSNPTEYIDSGITSAKPTFSESYDYKASRPLLSTRSSKYAGKFSSISKILSLAENLQNGASSSNENPSNSNDFELCIKSQNPESLIPIPQKDIGFSLTNDGLNTDSPVTKNSTPSSPPVMITRDPCIDSELVFSGPFRALNDKDGPVIGYEIESKNFQKKTGNEVITSENNSDFFFDDDEEILRAVHDSRPAENLQIPVNNEIAPPKAGSESVLEFKAELKPDNFPNEDNEIIKSVQDSRVLIDDKRGMANTAGSGLNFDHLFEDDDDFYGIETFKEETNINKDVEKIENSSIILQSKSIIDYDNLFDDEDDEDLAAMDRMIEAQMRAEKTKSPAKIEDGSKNDNKLPISVFAIDKSLPAYTPISSPKPLPANGKVALPPSKSGDDSITKSEGTFCGSDSDYFDSDINILEHEMQHIVNQAKIPANRSKPGIASVIGLDSPNLQSSLTDNGTEVKIRQSTPPRLDVDYIIRKPNCHRYLVKDVQVGVFKTETNGSITEYDEFFLTVVTAEDLIVSVHLRDHWYDAPSQPCAGDIIHIIGDYNPTSENIVLDRSNYLLIINPDVLVTCTAAAEAFRCPRSVILKERIREITATNKFMVFGTILHEIIQACLSSGVCSEQKLHDELKLAIQIHLQEIIIVEETPDSVAKHIQSKIPVIKNWFGKYLGPKPSPYSFIEDSENGYKSTMSITDIIDLEEEIYSPMYGLKGKIDCTVQTMIDNPKYNGKYLVPLEVKTGSRYGYLAHRAQTSLYTLMMSDRYEMKINFGLLYYSETGDTIKIPSIWKEHRDLLIQRNNIARYLKSERELPVMYKDERECGKCFKKKECMIYHKTKDGGTPETSGVPRLFIENTQSIELQHSRFFDHWDSLLSKEEKEVGRFKKDLWTMTSSQREKSGKCFGGMIIKSQKMIQEGVEKKFEIVFEKNPNILNSTINYSDYTMPVGEFIIISDEQGHFCLATGFLKSVNRRSVTVLVNRRVGNSRQKLPGFDFENNQVFMSMLNVQDDLLTSQNNGTNSFRIDPDEFASAMRVARNNLLQLLMPTSDMNRRSLIVDFKPPVFKSISPNYDRSSITKLNEDQKVAIERIMKAEDYSLLLGMPGTGKTTTIAQIIRMLVKAGKSILLASYTHSAVDNILLKLLNDDINILRLGSSTKAHANVGKYVEANKGKPQSAEELREIYMKPSVIATTCLGINHWLFSRRKFDYCIVDEASQLTLPLCLGPLRFADKFVLVGDHYQLSPLVKNPEALNGGLDISLFKLLCEKNPQAVTNLTYQYRMCKDIMLLSNTLIYEGKLKCGTEAVANQALQVPYIKGMDPWRPSNLKPQKDWLSPVMDCENRVMFLNTDNIPEARETSANDKGVYNGVETEIVRQITECLCTCGVNESSIGILSVYRSQLYKISNVLKHRPALEILTADRFQGRDKDCIIISLVRSNDQQYVGDLLRDWRRLNVTFTRAMSKIIIVGSKTTLEGVEVLEKFFNLIKQQGWIYDLPFNCISIYNCPPASSLTQEHAWSQVLRSSKSKSSVYMNDENKDNGLAYDNNHSAEQSVFRIGMKALSSKPILRDVMNNQH